MFFIKITWNDAVIFDGPAIVHAGFTALGQAPVWYQGLLVSIIAAAAGINEYKKHNQKMRLADMKKKTS